MSTTMGFLIAGVAIAIVVSFVRWQMKLKGQADRSRSRAKFLERERDRDRLACRAAALSLGSDAARGEVARAPVSARAGRSRAVPSGDRRSSGSTAFDPDVPGA